MHSCSKIKKVHVTTGFCQYKDILYHFDREDKPDNYTISLTKDKKFVVLIDWVIVGDEFTFSDIDDKSPFIPFQIHKFNELCEKKKKSIEVSDDEIAKMFSLFDYVDPNLYHLLPQEKQDLLKYL